jgi:hypothetical protein
MAGGAAACGGSSASSSAAKPSTAATSAATPGGGGGGGGAFGQQFTQIEQCLKAAGIAVPTASFRPRGSGRPSDRPSFVRPSGTARPSGFPRRGGGFGALFQNPQAQAALKACGIALPSFGARRSGAPGPGTAQGSPAT